MLPDEGLGAAREARERGALDAALAGMAPDEVAAVARETEELRQRQETPDLPEALACVPSLQLGDMPTKAPSIPSATSRHATGATVLRHDLFTNDVLYLDAALDMSALPAELLPLVPLFCRWGLAPAVAMFWERG